MYRLENRLARLERYQEEEEADSAVTIRLSFEGQSESDQSPLEPGTRILHVTLDGPSWWGVIDEDGTEEWIGYA